MIRNIESLSVSARKPILKQSSEQVSIASNESDISSKGKVSFSLGKKSATFIEEIEQESTAGQMPDPMDASAADGGDETTTNDEADDTLASKLRFFFFPLNSFANSFR